MASPNVILLFEADSWKLEASFAPQIFSLRSCDRGERRASARHALQNRASAYHAVEFGTYPRSTTNRPIVSPHSYFVERAGFQRFAQKSVSATVKFVLPPTPFPSNIHCCCRRSRGSICLIDMSDDMLPPFEFKQKILSSNTYPNGASFHCRSEELVRVFRGRNEKSQNAQVEQ